MEAAGTSSFTSTDTKAHLIQLETENIRILRLKEESWRLKSRALWLKARDENSKFFHQYAQGRKAINTIWELHDSEGREAKTFHQLADMGVHHFSNIYKAPRGVTLPNIISLAEALPSFVDPEETEALLAPVMMGELETSMKCFQKDNSPGLDGWLVEFYNTFFELIGSDLLKSIEEYKTSGRMHEGFNAKFLTLIPKIDKPLTFDDYCPISLCNNLYKIIPKTIALRVNQSSLG